MKQTILFTLFATFSFSVANAQVPSYVPTDGLVGWWPFNGDAADESGNGNDGTVVGATLTEDRYNNANHAYFFNGLNNKIQLNNSSSLNIISDITISIWFKANTIDRPLLWRGDAQVARDPYIVYFHLDNLKFRRDVGSGTTLNEVGIPTSMVNTKSWNHIIAKFNAITNEMTIYFNGVLAVQQILPGTINYSTNSMSTQFGAIEDLPGFYGLLDDIGIWNRALTDEEILNLHNACTVTSSAIVGENAPLNFTTSTYFCNDNPGSSYTWTVTNGVISSGQGTNSIVVLWGNEGEGTVSVIETNAEGCDGPVASFVVDVQCSSNITSIDGNINPVILSPIAYTVNGPADSEYTWSVSNGVIVSGQGTNSVNVIWAAEGEGTLSVIETTSTGCESPVVTITTNATVTSVIEQEDKRISIYPNPASDRITLQCGAENIGDEYIIYDALGKIVMRGKIINTLTTININELRSGEYFIKIGEEVIKAVKE